MIRNRILNSLKEANSNTAKNYITKNPADGSKNFLKKEDADIFHKQKENDGYKVKRTIRFNGKQKINGITKKMYAHVVHWYKKD